MKRKRKINEFSLEEDDDMSARSSRRASEGGMAVWT